MVFTRTRVQKAPGVIVEETRIDGALVGIRGITTGRGGRGRVDSSVADRRAREESERIAAEQRAKKEKERRLKLQRERDQLEAKRREKLQREKETRIETRARLDRERDQLRKDAGVFGKGLFPGTENRLIKEFLERQQRKREETKLPTIKQIIEEQRPTVQELRQTLTVEGAKKPTGILEIILNRIQKIRFESLAKTQRGGGLRSGVKSQVFGLAGALTTIGIGFKDLGKLGVQTIRDPGETFRTGQTFLLRVGKNPIRTLRNIGISASAKTKQFGAVLRSDPNFAAGWIVGEVIGTQATGKAIKFIGGISDDVVTRLSPKFLKLRKGSLILRSGRKLKLISGGQVKKVSFKSQVLRAGKKVSPVSAQADELVTLTRRGRIIRKPIPGENLLSVRTKRLLKKFDAGKIDGDELLKLNSNILRETRGAGNLLERSFFASPDPTIRKKRLGLQQKDASLLDILSGDISFRTNTPQILIFDDIKLQAFPKTKTFLKIKSKLKAGKTLSKFESDELLKFQLKKSGRFKPIGQLTKEPEITISPSEIIRREKVVGVTLIDGKRVKIIKAKIVKPSIKLKKLLKEARTGNLSQKELNLAKKLLKKEGGFKVSLRSRRGLNPRVSLRPTGLKIISRIARRKRKLRGLRKRPKIRPFVKRRVAKRLVRRKVKVTRARPTPRKPAKPTVRRKVKRPVRRRPTVRRVARVVRGKKVARVLPKEKKIFKKVKRKKRQQSFDVFARPIKRKGAKKRPKLIRVNKVGLTKIQAQDLKATILDTSLVRTGRIKPSKRKLGKPVLRVSPGIAKRTQKKFRSFRIVRGQRRRLPKGTKIERKGHLLDTRGERKSITLRKRISQLSKPRRVSVVARRKGNRPVRIGKLNKEQLLRLRLLNLKRGRKILELRLKQKQRTSGRRVATRPISSSQRKTQQLKNLAKARRVRARNLKRRK